MGTQTTAQTFNQLHTMVADITIRHCASGSDMWQILAMVKFIPTFGSVLFIGRPKRRRAGIFETCRQWVLQKVHSAILLLTGAQPSCVSRVFESSQKMSRVPSFSSSKTTNYPVTIIMITQAICIAPSYHTRWETRALNHLLLLV